jgi:two-component system response regulator MprA
MSSVLIVDDDRALLRLLSRLFLFEGYEVYLAASGEEAIETVSRITPDLIVLDLNMPQMKGEELHQRLRSGGFGGTFLVVSATDRAARIAGELGSWFVAKPFDPAYLVSVAASLILPAVEEPVPDTATAA